MTARDNIIAERLAILIGCVNARPFRGKPAGTLLVARVEFSNLAGGARITLKHDPDGWNNAPDPSGRRWPVIDAVGESLRPPAVFPAGWEYEIVEGEARP